MQGVDHHTRGHCPDQVVMNATKTIVAIYCDRLNCFTLAIDCKHGPFFELHVNVYDILNADELVKTQIALGDLILIVLHDTCLVDSFSYNSKRAQLCVLRKLNFEFMVF